VRFSLAQVWVGALLCGGVGLGIFLVIVGVRGVEVDPTRPEGRLRRARVALASPAATGQAVGALAAAVITLVVTHWPVAALGLGALVAFWPRLFGGGRAEQRQILRLEALVIWTEALRDTIAAHASLERAIPASAQQAPPLIRPALVRLAGQISARAPLDRALLGLAADLDDPSADLVLAALVLNVRRRGDRLAIVLTGLARAAREELDMRRRVSAGRAGLRRGVQIVVALTVGFVIYLTIFSRDYVAPYDSPLGQVALAVVIGMFAVGFAWMRQLSATPDVRPFLARPGTDISDADIRVVSALTGAPGRRVRELAEAGRGPWSGAAGGQR
jgi:tight adherence protein B